MFEDLWSERRGFPLKSWINFSPQLIIKKSPNFMFEDLWSERRGSNSRQPAWKAGALPTELLSHLQQCKYR